MKNWKPKRGESVGSIGCPDLKSEIKKKIEMLEKQLRHQAMLISEVRYFRNRYYLNFSNYFIGVTFFSFGHLNLWAQPIIQ